MTDFAELRAQMVRDQIEARGVTSAAVLNAMRLVPREAFVDADLAEFAYDDTPLPIASEQTISQPYIVAEMIRAAAVAPGDRVLEIGAGSGYAAAVISRIATDVYAVERHAALARAARQRLAALGYDNVSVLEGDGTLGWPEHAPYDAIVVSTGGPSAPAALLDQLAIGGRLVIPIGATPRVQRLVRITRQAADRYDEDDLGAVQFVPLIGVGGWEEDADVRPRRRRFGTDVLTRLIRESAEPIDDIESVSLSPCSTGWAMPGWCCSVRPLTERQNSIACARASHASSFYGEAFGCSRSRPTGPMPRSSTVTFATCQRAHGLGKRSVAFPVGCGETKRRASSSSGCANTIEIKWIRARASVFTASICTRCTRPLRKSSTTSIGSIPSRRLRPKRGTVASRPGRVTRPRMDEPRSWANFVTARLTSLPCSVSSWRDVSSTPRPTATSSSMQSKTHGW